MSENKNLDRLFQEKFKDFEMQPAPEIWTAIEQKLNKKKRKPFLLWYSIGGIAALLLLFFTLGKTFIKTENNSTIKNDVVTVPIKLKNENTKKDEVLVVDNYQKEEKQHVKIINKIVKPLKSTLKNSKLALITPVLTVDKNAIIKNNTVEKSSSLNKKNHQFVISKKKDRKTINNLKKEEELNADNSKQLDLKLEDEIKREDKNKEPKLKDKKFSVGTSYSPIYYASLSKGSSIDESISDNYTSNEFSVTYGVKFAYKINDKLSIQTGLHNVDLAYTTDDVRVSLLETAANSLKLSNLATTTGGNKLNVASMELSRNILEVDDYLRFTIISATGDLLQHTSYLEVPLELKYNVIGKKINIEVLGGFSTLFLNKNEVYLNSNNKTRFILGEASNLEKTNFSANLGIDLNYNFSKKWFVNITPSFKYQLNTFTERSGGFKPYTLSINTGLNFRF